MPIEMPKGLPFSVDTWTPSSKIKRHHFLTHAHKDHSQGITTHFSYPIYSTHLTKTLTLQYYPQLDDSLFVGIEAGQSMIIDDPDGEFLVTAFDANHCPGAVMFLFEGNFGNILHTGDCRLTPECLQSLPEKYIGKKGKEPRCPLDYVFLDCTFGKSPLKMPSKHSAIRQIINCIWKHPDAKVVYLTCDLLGQEDILVNVSQTFGSKIFVDEHNNSECFNALKTTAREVLARDMSSRFHLFEGFPRLNERAKAKITEARANDQPDPLIIRASAQWYVCDDEILEREMRIKERCNEAVKDPCGVWHVCYSMHSSRDELEWALQLLRPKRVVSTTPNCWAMELNYVKKHCFGTRLASSDDDPLWKLLDINPGTSKELIEEAMCSSPVKGSSETTVETWTQVEKMSTAQKQLVLSVLSLTKSPPITLFGRARLGFSDFTSPQKEKKLEYVNDEATDRVFENKVEQDLSIQEDIVELESGNSLESKIDSNEVQNGEKSELKRANICENSSYSSVGSSKRGFNESFRKLYRSMNVPMPQPLPSLVELMNANKRAKRRFHF